MNERMTNQKQKNLALKELLMYKRNKCWTKLEY